MNPYLMRGLVGAGLGAGAGALAGGHDHRLQGAISGGIAGGGLGAFSAHPGPQTSSLEDILTRARQHATAIEEAGGSVMDQLKARFADPHVPPGVAASPSIDLGPAGPSKLGAFYQQGRDEAFRRFVR